MANTRNKGAELCHRHDLNSVAIADDRETIEVRRSLWASNVLQVCSLR